MECCLTLGLVKYLPAWFPGARFVKIAQGYKSRAQSFSDVPYAFTKQQISNGSFVPSFLSNLLRDNPVEPGTEEEEIIKWSAGSLYAGGADTVRADPGCTHYIKLTKSRLSPQLQVSFSPWPFFRRRNTRLSRNSTQCLGVIDYPNSEIEKAFHIWMHSSRKFSDGIQLYP